MDNNVTSVICPVCASEIVGVAHVCGRCRTPHHGDCAAFIGRCALFGCGGSEFAEQSLDAARLQVPSADAEAPAGRPEASLSLQPRMRRGIGGRLVAAGRLVMGNLGIFVPLLGLSVACNFAFGFFGTMLTPQFIQCLLIILLVSRAKGKESSLAWAVGALLRRLPRIVWNFLVVGFVVGVLMSVGGMLMWASASAMRNEQPVLALMAGLLATLVLWKAADRTAVYQLSQVVAALGKEEEPANPRSRSEELVGVGYWQAFATFFLFAAGGALIGGFAGRLKVVVCASYGLPHVAASSVPVAVVMDLLTHALIGAMGLLVSTFWVLFYLEARKAKKPADLAFTSSEFVPRAGE